jgi:hypothetical protein
VDLTDAGQALRAEAEKIPPAIVDRLGMDVSRLLELHRALTEVIAATDSLPPDVVAPAPGELARGAGTSVKRR